MDEIDAAVSAAKELAGIVGAGWAGRKLLGPTLDAYGVDLAAMRPFRHKNLTAIAAKTERLRPNSPAYPSPRVVQRVLNDASLYDDDVMQTYVAGMLAGSRNDDGSDDRPVFYLSVIDSLTAKQLRVFHILYSALRDQRAVSEKEVDPSSYVFEFEVFELEEAIRLMDPEDEMNNSLVAALEHVGLISHLSVQDQGTRWVMTYGPTRVGVLLYDWAHGYEEEAAHKFFERAEGRPDLDLPSHPFTTLRRLAPRAPRLPQ